MMKSKICYILFLVVFLIGSLLGWNVMAADDQINVAINGQKMIFPDQEPVVYKDRTFVPMRVIFERLGAEIIWNPDTERVTATTDSITIILRLGSQIATVNDRCIELDVPARVINNRTMVPLRFVGESLGAEVKWVEKTKTVEISIPEMNTDTNKKIKIQEG